MAVAVVDVQVNSQQAVRNLQQVNTASRASAAGINVLKSALGPLLAAFTAVNAIKFTVVKTAELETQTRSLQTLTGSVEKAKQIIQELQRLGAATPFTSTELIDVAKRLAAFGVSTAKVVETTRRLGDVAGATSANLGELSLAYGQVIAKGRLQGEELLQFQERGVALQDELRKMYGLTGEEFQKALSKGRISAEAVEVAIVRLTNQGGKYANGAIAQSDTLAGKFSTLTDGVEMLARRIGQVLTPALKSVLDLANQALNKINEALAGPAYKEANDQLFNTRARIQELTKAIKAAEAAGIQLERSAPILGVDGQVMGGGQPVLPGMKYELQQLQKEAKRLEDRLKELRAPKVPAGKQAASTTPPALLAEQATGGGRSMDSFLGGAIKAEMERQKALLATQKQIQLNTAATGKNAEQAQRMVNFAFEYKELQVEIDALSKTLSAREQYRNQIISQAKDKEQARIDLLQAEDMIRAEINNKRLAFNLLEAKQRGEITAATIEQQKRDAQLTQAGQERLQQLIDEQELLQARLAGNEAEVILRQQIRDTVKDTKGLDEADVKSKLQGIEALKKQLEIANEMKRLYEDIGMSIKDGVVDAIQGAIQGTKTLQQTATDLLNSVANKLLDVAINLALFGVMSGTGTGGGLLGGLFKKRAMGGSVTAGQPYLVGERGPELFMPGRSGGIAPTGSFGGGVNVVVNVDASGTSVEGNEPNSNQMGRIIGAAVQAEIVKMQRPGGLLANTR